MVGVPVVELQVAAVVGSAVHEGLVGWPMVLVVQGHSQPEGTRGKAFVDSHCRKKSNVASALTQIFSYNTKKTKQVVKVQVCVLVSNHFQHTYA